MSDTTDAEPKPESAGDLPTDQQIADLTWRLFDVFDELTQRSADGTLFPAVEPGSRMAADDAITAPYHFSHTLQTLLTNAIEHARAISALVRDAGIVHGGPPFTLARAVIESAGTAYWMLDSPDQRERIKRHLTHQSQDRYDYQTAAKLMMEWTDGQLPEDVETRKTYIAEVRQQVGLRTLPSQLTTGKMMQDVDRSIDKRNNATEPSAHFERFWRTASGFGHGRPWARMNVLVRAEVTQISDELATVRFVTNPARVLWSVATAHELTDRALAEYARACQAARS